MTSISHSQIESTVGFDCFDLSPVLLRALRAAGYAEPRPIQARTIPGALAGRDVLGLAQTGTGKTAAFALPILERLLSRPGRGPRVLIVAPTRELAVQIDAEIRTLAKGTQIKTLTVFGGASERPQIQKLRQRPEILVACPGRLLDLVGRGLVRLDRIEVLVLDEADHMFDMGFLPDIRRIIAKLPDRRQNLLFAATMPSEIRKLVNDVLRNPAVAELVHSVPPGTIEHAFYPVVETRKFALLKHFLAETDVVSAIVFTRTKHRARSLARKLERSGLKAIALQGNMSQRQRDYAMQGFRARRFDVLVATDVAARGIDVDRVSHVINFDIPNTPDAYTHRIGRTGRSERTGRACTFVGEADHNAVLAIERRIGAKIPRRTVDGFDFTAEERQSASPRDGKVGAGAGQKRRRRHGRPRGKGGPSRSQDPRHPDTGRRGSRQSKRPHRSGPFSGELV